MSDEQLLSELSRVAREIGSTTLTIEQFRTHADGVSQRVIVHRFGSWSEALERAGLVLASRGRRWTDGDYAENILTVWTYYGRAPHYGEMNRPPSKITAGGYEKKFGTWAKARASFIDQVNADLGYVSRLSNLTREEQLVLPSTPRSLTREDSRVIPLGLRYKVLQRDRFRCVTCGRSPATDLAVELHVDHLVPMARGGKTTVENLRALCSDCNLGKGSS